MLYIGKVALIVITVLLLLPLVAAQKIGVDIGEITPVAIDVFI